MAQRMKKTCTFRQMCLKIEAEWAFCIVAVNSWVLLGGESASLSYGSVNKSVQLLQAYESFSFRGNTSDVEQDACRGWDVTNVFLSPSIEHWHTFISSFRDFDVNLIITNQIRQYVSATNSCEPAVTWRECVAARYDSCSRQINPTEAFCLFTFSFAFFKIHRFYRLRIGTNKLRYKNQLYCQMFI